MPCARTIEAWRPAAGGPLRFQHPTDGRAYSKIQIPCGYCILCQQEHARQWGVRITHEAQFWDVSSFVTLTYAPQHLPTWGSLNYHDLQKFWKRLRKNHGPMRYYACGEYGDDSMRPHYHACIFGHAFVHDRIMVRTQPTPLWTSPTLEEAWGLGQVTVGALTFETAQYTASYVLKKTRSGKQYVRIDEETGELIRLVQPRAFMSRNLGEAWWHKHNRHTTAHDFVVINGRKQKPPKAYDRWLGKVDPDKLEEIKAERQSNAERLTEDQNRARAQNAHARARQKSKTV